MVSVAGLGRGQIRVESTDPLRLKSKAIVETGLLFESRGAVDNTDPALSVRALGRAWHAGALWGLRLQGPQEHRPIMFVQCRGALNKIRSDGLARDVPAKGG